MKISVVVSFLLLTVLSCGENNFKTKESEVQNSKPESESKITAKAIEQFDYIEYVLSNEAEDAVKSWEKYQELKREVSYLKKADLSFFNTEGNTLTEFTTALKKTIPADLKTNPIFSRVIILETKILKLNDNLILDNIALETQLQSIKEVLVAYSNLNLQINKKLEFDEFDKIQPE